MTLYNPFGGDSPRLPMTRPEIYLNAMDTFGGLYDTKAVHYWWLVVDCLQCPDRHVGKALYKTSRSEPATLRIPRRVATEHDGHHLVFNWYEESDPEHNISGLELRTVEAGGTPWRWLS